MRAIRVQNYGGPEVLALEELETPQPGPAQCLVAVDAAGVIATDLYMRAGLFDGFLGLRVPYTPGWDYSGVVIAAGPNARHQVGDAVYGFLPGQGTYAEFLVAGVDDIAHRPAGLDGYEAADLPLAACTAWKALHEVAALRPGARLLVVGASGGVGSCAVQLGLAAGATVTGVASPAKAGFVEGLGASVLLRNAPAHERRSQRADVILDTVGPQMDPLLLDALAPDGLVVRVGGPPDSVRDLHQVGRRAVFSGTEPNAGRLAHITRLVEQGRLRAYVDRIFPLESAALAHRALEAGEVQGKLVLAVSHRYLLAPSAGAVVASMPFTIANGTGLASFQ